MPFEFQLGIFGPFKWNFENHRNPESMEPHLERLFTVSRPIPEERVCTGAVVVNSLPLETITGLPKSNLSTVIDMNIEKQRELIMKKLYRMVPKFESEYEISVIKVYCGYMKQLVGFEGDSKLALKELIERLYPCASKLSDNVPLEVVYGQRKLKEKGLEIEKLKQDMGELEEKMTILEQDSDSVIHVVGNMKRKIERDSEIDVAALNFFFSVCLSHG